MIFLIMHILHFICIRTLRGIVYENGVTGTLIFDSNEVTGTLIFDSNEVTGTLIFDSNEVTGTLISDSDVK